MKDYLETMGVTELAIQAHEKGEIENDTYITIELEPPKVKLTKRSRVNNDLIIELELDKESLEELLPGDRVKRSLATSQSQSLDHLQIESSLTTMNGMARILDIKTLSQEEEKTVLVQELTVTNEQRGVSHTTTRYFNPYTETPPHLAVDVDADVVMEDD
jgi:hypothetical protein